MGGIRVPHDYFLKRVYFWRRLTIALTALSIAGWTLSALIHFGVIRV